MCALCKSRGLKGGGHLPLDPYKSNCCIIVNKAIQNAPKCTSLRTKVAKFYGKRAQPPPQTLSPAGRDTAPTIPTPSADTRPSPLEKNPAHMKPAVHVEPHV